MTRTHSILLRRQRACGGARRDSARQGSSARCPPGAGSRLAPADARTSGLGRSGRAVTAAHLLRPHAQSTRGLFLPDWRSRVSSCPASRPRVRRGAISDVTALSPHAYLLHTVAKKYNSPNQPEGTRKEGTSVLHNVQVTPQG